MNGAPAWDDDPLVAGWAGLPRLEGSVSADVCVVGLGGSGLAAVESAVERGLRVVGVDAGRVGAGAAGRNGGFLLGGPAPFLHDAIRTWDEYAVDLYRATLAELDHLAEMLGPSVIDRCGSIRLAGLPGGVAGDSLARAFVGGDSAADDEAADCAALAATLRAYGIAVQDYDGDLGRGIFLPDDAATNPARRVLATAALLRGRADLFEGSPARSVMSGVVETDRGRVWTGVVLVAVDGTLDLLLPRLAGRVRTARLQMLATAPVPVRLTCPVYGRWGYDYAQQAADGRLLVGGGRDRFADTEWTHDNTPTREVQSYLDTLAARFAGGPVNVTHRWAASVGFTPDGRALCGEVAPGVVVCGGYSGTGNLVGPVAARAALAHALDATPIPPYFAPPVSG